MAKNFYQAGFHLLAESLAVVIKKFEDRDSFLSFQLERDIKIPVVVNYVFLKHDVES